MDLNLIPEVEGEGGQWRFLGLQSKNRREWGLAHIANFHNKCTSVGLYDTLGNDAIKYVIKQTGMSCIACQGDIVGKLLDMKIEETKNGETDGMLASFK